MSRLTYRYVALPKVWPGRQRPAGFKPKRSPFKIRWTNTESMLAREILYLGGKDVTLAVDVRNPGFFRQDGMLRADARPATSAVVLSFTNRQGVRLTFPCDTFGFWQDNVHAIALALESLRRVDRYGVTQGEQYVGFAALPASTGAQALTVDAAAEILAQYAPFPARLIVEEPSVATVALRIARQKSHPDQGGSDDAFREVQRAGEVLDSFHPPEDTEGDSHAD